MPKHIRNINVVILDDNKQGIVEALEIMLKKAIPEAITHPFEAVDDFLKKPTHQLIPDVVLLDVMDMDMKPAHAIPRILKRWPQLPVLMLTRVDEIGDALDYFKFGAKGFLLKRELGLDDSTETYTYSLEALEQAWEEAAKIIRIVAKDYQPVKNILQDNRIVGIIRKERGPNSPNSPITEQIEFLRRIEMMEDRPRIRELFPHPITVLDADNAYEIPFYRAKSLRRAMFESSSQDSIPRIAELVLRPLLVTLKRELFDENSKLLPEGDHPEFEERFYAGKLRQRLEDTREMIDKLDTDPDRRDIREAEKEALLKLLNATDLIINGKPMKAPIECLQQILLKDKDTKKLFPKKVGWIHGDLHFDNILVDVSVPERPFVKLIDPRGDIKGVDFAYDIGKLLHSCNGKYDMIDEGYLSAEYAIADLDRDKQGSLIVKPPRMEGWVHREESGGSQDIVISQRRIVTQRHFEEYDRITEWLVKELQDIMTDDPDWEVRARLNEALHFCTMGPFHLKRSPKKVFTLYLRGVQLMNELANKLEVTDVT